MFSGSHFLLNRKQCVMSKVAKPRPMNLVSKDLLSAQKDPPHDSTIAWNSPGTEELDQKGVLARSRKLLRDTNRNHQMYSQQRQQGDAQSFSTWKKGRRDESSNSARAGKLSVRGEDNQFGKSKFHFHNMQISHYRYFENVFKNLQKKLSLAGDAPPIRIEELKTSVLIWGLFMSTAMKAAIHLGPNYNEYLEVCSNTNFEELQNVPYYSEVGIASSSGDSECENDDMDISFMDEIYTFSRSGDQVDESETSRVLRIRLELIENRLSSSGIFSQDIRCWRSSREFRKICKIKTLIASEKFGDRIIFMSIFDDIEWTKITVLRKLK